MKAAGATRRLVALRVLAGAAFVAYPVLIWIGLSRWSPRLLAVVLLGVLIPIVVLRWRSGEAGPSRRAMSGLAVLPLLTAAALIVAAVLDAGGSMLLVPVAVNAALLVAFGLTLRPASVPMIERFARLQRSELSAQQQAWCRLWTRIWCLFFVLNGATALVLAFAAPLAWWALYNGGLAYALIGLLLATEWVLRRRRFGANAGGPGERDAAGDGQRSAAGERDAGLGGAAGLRLGRTDAPRVPYADP